MMMNKRVRGVPKRGSKAEEGWEVGAAIREGKGAMLKAAKDGLIVLQRDGAQGSRWDRYLEHLGKGMETILRARSHSNPK